MNIKEILKERDPTQGSIIKNIFLMTWPLWINSGFYLVFWWFNMYWVSRLGSVALAAVVTGGAAFMLMMTIIQGIVTSTFGLIGNLVGQKDEAGLQSLAKEILAIGFILSLIIAAAGYFIAPILLQFIGSSPEVLSLATTYFRIQVLGGTVTFSLWIINGMIRATGDMGRPMIVIFSMIVLNAIFDPFLILGVGYTGLGVAGAALSSVLSAGIGAGLAFWFLLSGKTPIKICLKNWRDFKIRFQTVKEVARISVFDTLETSSKVMIDMVLLKFIALYGVAALAAYGIGQRLLRMSSMFGCDLATTTAITMSNNLGAGNQKRAEKSSWISAGMNVLIMGVAAVVLFVFANQVLGVFSADQNVIDLGVKYLKITAPGFIFLAAATVLRRAFGGAKDTRTPMWISFLAYGVFQLGLAWFLPKLFNLEACGIWIAILVAMVVNGLILAILFKAGHWKSKNKAT